MSGWLRGMFWGVGGDSPSEEYHPPVYVADSGMTAGEWEDIASDNAYTLPVVTVSRESKEARERAYNNRVALTSAKRDEARERMAQQAKLNSHIRSATNRVAPYVGGVLSAPLISAGVGAAVPVLNNPIVDAALTIDGVHNFFTDNGVKKTINHINNGEYGKAALSGLGDVLDIAGGANLLYKTGRILNPHYRSKISEKMIAPYGYKPEYIKPWLYGLWYNDVPKGFKKIKVYDGKHQFQNHRGNLEYYHAPATHSTSWFRFLESQDPKSQYPLKDAVDQFYIDLSRRPMTEREIDFFNDNVLEPLKKTTSGEDAIKLPIEHINNFKPWVDDVYNIGDRNAALYRIKEIEKRFGQAMPPDEILANTIENIINSERSDISHIPNSYVTELRNYYRGNNIDLSKYTDEDLKKVIINQINDLSSRQSGILKGIPVWHGSGNYFDAFDWKTNLGRNTGNAGVSGSGNYFFTQPALYGYKRGGGQYLLSQPYLISDVNNIIDLRPFKNNKHSFSDLFNEGEKVLKDENTVVLGPQTSSFFMDTPELVIKRDNGIKSLYPHPSTANGKLFIRNWEDNRLNYKDGGPIDTLGAIDSVYKSKAEFADRLRRGDKTVIPTWDAPGYVSSMKMSSASDDNGAFVYPEVQMVNGKLIEFTRPPYLPGTGVRNAVRTGNIIYMPNDETAKCFANDNYKNYFDVVPKK